MGIFILEKGASPYWGGGSRCARLQERVWPLRGWRYDHRRPPPEGPQGEGFRCPNLTARRLAPMFPHGCGIQSWSCNFHQNLIDLPCLEARAFGIFPPGATRCHRMRASQAGSRVRFKVGIVLQQDVALRFLQVAVASQTSMRKLSAGQDDAP